MQPTRIYLENKGDDKAIASTMEKVRHMTFTEIPNLLVAL
jgi:hypothetical protein